MKSNLKRHFLLTLAASLLLTACGGSDNNEPRSKDLYSVYEVVTEGMSLAQLTTVIGFEPSGSRADEDDITMYSWVADKGSYLRRARGQVLPFAFEWCGFNL